VRYLERQGFERGPMFQVPPNSNNLTAMRASIVKFCVIMLLLIVGWPYLGSEYSLYAGLSRRLFVAERWIPLGVYSLIALAGAASVFISPFLSNALIRVVFTLIFTINATILVLYCQLTGAHLGNSEITIFDLLWRERAMAWDVLPGYKSEMIYAVMLVLPVVAVLCAPSSAKLRLQGWWNAVPAVSVAGAFIVIVFTKGGMEQYFPTTGSLPAKVALGSFFGKSTVLSRRAPWS
jgi:hypothetical protein